MVITWKRTDIITYGLLHAIYWIYKILHLGSVPFLRNWKWPNFWKTFEIPTPKPDMLLFLVLRGIKWFVDHRPRGYSWSPRTGSDQISSKRLKSQLTIPTPYLFLFLVSRGITWYMVKGPGVVLTPFDQEVRRYLLYKKYRKVIDILIPKPYIFVHWVISVNLINSKWDIGNLIKFQKKEIIKYYLFCQ